MVEELIGKLCEEIGLVMPEKVKKSYCLKISDLDEIEVKELEVGLSLHAGFGAMPEEEKEEMATHLMQANFLGEGTGGCVISLNGKCLTLSLAMPYEVSYKTFKEKVEEFVNYLGYWREKVEHGSVFNR